MTSEELHEFIECLRAALGLAPLYGERESSPWWDGWPAPEDVWCGWRVTCKRGQWH